MSEFGKIDDPVDASFEAWPEESPSIGEKVGEFALSFSGLIFPPAKILKILKDQFAIPNRLARVIFLLDGFRLGLKLLQSEQASDRERLKRAEDKLDTPQFFEAVAAACEEASRTTNDKKIQQLAAALVGSLRGSQWSDPNEDIPTMIRDIAQLGDKDLKVLSILRQVHASAISHAPNLNDPDGFSRETPTLKRKIAESGIHPDDFLATCERLRGFGLAAEVLRNTSHMAPQDYCYRPTRRGLVVLDYLEATAKRGNSSAREEK